MLLSNLYDILIQVLSPPVQPYKQKSCPHIRPEFCLTSFPVSLVPLLLCNDESFVGKLVKSE